MTNQIMQEKEKNDLIATWTVFESEQLLTAGQLNKLRSHLYKQIQLTRTALIGIGIACGLEVHFDKNKNKLIITEGLGITSNGDLVCLDKDKKYSYRRSTKSFIEIADSYNNNGNDKSADNHNIIAAYELIDTNTHEQTNENNLKKLNLSFLEGKITILFLKENRVCERYHQYNCDAQSCSKKFVLKAYLVDSGSIPSLDTEDKYKKLQDILIKRIIYKESFQDVENAFKNSIDENFNQVCKAISNSYEVCKGLLNQDFAKTTIDSWIGKMRKISNSDNIAWQYRYDFLLDVIDTYKEFKEVLFGFNDVCINKARIFHRYLVLGAANEVGKTDTTITLNDPYRHFFYPMSILNGSSSKLKKARFLFKRIHCMIYSFDSDNLENQTEIKITPSQSNEFPLGDRAIPFYYKYEDNTPLYKYWNYDISIRRRTENIYSYYADKYSGIENPLEYDTRDYPFFRIEGHLGKDLKEVKNKLEKQIKDHNLPIRILSYHTEKVDFAKLMKKHPGIEHVAGVMRGGTFILCFNSGNKVVADFALPYSYDKSLYDPFKWLKKLSFYIYPFVFFLILLCLIFL